MFDTMHKFINGFFGDNAHVQKPFKRGEFHTISELLPYRAYDDANDIYLNHSSVGAVIEASPLIGATENTVKSITSMIKNDMPEGVSVQFINYASPKVGPMFDGWVEQRQKKGGIYSKLAEKRVEYLKKFTHEPFFSSDDNPRGFVIRDFKLIIAISMPAAVEGSGKHKSIIKHIRNVRTAIESSMDNIGGQHCKVKPQRFIELLGEIFNMNKEIYSDKVTYNPLTSINKQITTAGTKIDVEPDHLLINDGEYEVRSFSVKNYPDVWTQWESTDLIGDFWENMLQIPCPFITMFSFTTGNHDKTKAKASMKAARSIQQAGTGITKYVPEIAEQAKDWSHVRSKMNEGERLVKTFYEVVIFAPSGQANNVEAKVKELYSSHGWLLARDKYMQMQSFMAILPMTLGEGLVQDLDKLGRLKTMLSWTCGNVAPLQGEWKGTNNPAIMLMGRRGQVMYWNPFENKDGNYNVAVVGKSGSGKSVFMQEYVAGLLGSGGQVVVIDDGRSFEHSCDLQNGEFLEFGSKNNICLNPFSLVNEQLANENNEYLIEVKSMIKQMVCQMCRESGDITDIEKSYIEKAVNAAWVEKSVTASMTTVREHLLTIKDPRAKDLSDMLVTFTADGLYGKYFEGKANISINNPLMVFELAELKTRKQLQSVVMMLLMFIVTEEMRKDRSVRTTLLIDEAWDLLSGGDISAFIEGIARRARKYGGNLVTGTQSVKDYYSNPAARAAIENTDWYCFLGQKADSIEQLKVESKLSMTESMERRLKSLHTVRNKYSEVMIVGPGIEAIGRLILDPFSVALYSSTGEDFVKVEKMMERGFSLEDAVSGLADEISGAA